jgi:HSP20 family protein
MSKAKTTDEKHHKPTEATKESHKPSESVARSGGAPARQSGQLAGRRNEISPWAHSSPFSFMRRFGEEMDRLFDDFGFGSTAIGSSLGRAFGPTGFERAMWSPQIEMFERQGRLVIRADLPGLSKDDVKVDLEQNVITIQGERRQEHEENREGYYRSERSYGSFHRTIPLPPGVDGEDAKARFRDGVLEIEMAAPERSASRRLELEEEKTR